MGRTDNPMVSRIELPLPVIDLSLFDLGDPWRDQVAAQIDSASSQFGFFYVVGHGIDTAVVDPLMEASGRFFAAAEAVRTQLAPDGAPATSAIAMRGQILLPEVPGFREPVLDYMALAHGARPQADGDDRSRTLTGRQLLRRPLHRQSVDGVSNR